MAAMGESRSGDNPPTGRRVTVTEAAEALGITVKTVRRRIKRGTIAHEREGRRVYVLLGSDQTPDSRDEDESIGPPSPGEWGRPRYTAFTKLIPLPRGFEYVSVSMVDQSWLNENPPRPNLSNNGDLVKNISPQFRGGFSEFESLRGRFERLPFYGICILAIAGAAVVDSLGLVPLGLVSKILTLKFIVTVIFGLYIGMKEANTSSWRSFHVLGVLAGLVAAGVVYLVARITGGGLAPTDVGPLGAIAQAGIRYVAGTWLTLMSGLILGATVQYKAEQERWGTLDQAPSGGRGDGVEAEKTSRLSIVLGFAGVIIGALLTSGAQIIVAIIDK